MTESERREFRLFCQQATDSQLEAIVKKEREAAETGDPYRETCAGIAEAVAAGRPDLIIW